MEPLVITVPVEHITDWPSFHDVFQRSFGFPDFYGRNMDAWIDCMTSLDTAEDGLTTVWVKTGQILILRIDDPFDFRRRCPEQYEALIECSAFVNFRRVEVGEPPVLALLFSGRTKPRSEDMQKPSDSGS
jgi:RNAse (barnase) inhibitor barstar